MEIYRAWTRGRQLTDEFIQQNACNFGDLKWHLSTYKISPTVRSLICKYGYFKSKSSVSLQQRRIGTPFIPPSETVLCPKMI